MRVGDHHVFEFVLARREDRGALVDFGRIYKIQHRKMLHVENFVHAFQAEAALAVQEVGDVGLFEAGLFRQTQAVSSPASMYSHKVLRRFLEACGISSREYNTLQ